MKPGKRVWSTETAKRRKEEAAPIAMLLDYEGKTTGWVYQWNTLELSILWIDQDRAVGHIDPPLCANTLTSAKAVTSDAVTELLETLSSSADKDPR